VDIQVSDFDDNSNALAFSQRAGVEPAIVFLHGSGFCKDVFDRQFDSPLLAQHRLIAIDLPGHGESPNAASPSATYSFSGFAKAVDSLLRKLGVQQCIVVGWSLGGHVALQMADRYPQVSGVMTMGTAPVSGGPLGLIRSMHLSRGLLLAGKSQFTRADAQMFEKHCLEQASDGRFLAALQRVDPQLRPSVSKYALTKHGLGQLGDLVNSRTATCLVHGAADPFIRTPYMRSLRAPTLYKGGAIVFASAGHAPFIAEQERFETLLLDFVDVAMARDDVVERSLQAA
jgi:pimeloyl-ACP methyl ester carboxylesterase